MTQSVAQKTSEPQMLRHCFDGYIFISRTTILITASYEKKEMLIILQKNKRQAETIVRYQTEQVGSRKNASDLDSGGEGEVVPVLN
jgi:hypothetical protein